MGTNGTKRSLELPGLLIRAVLPRYFKGADWLIASFFLIDDVLLISLIKKIYILK